jgi:predicted phage terminase large subunit-like protein
MMKIRCESDLPLFCRVFFPHHCREPFSALHRHLFRHYRRQQYQPLLERKGRNYAVAAPRGYAKSTLATLLLPIHDVVYRSEGYIIIVSATLPQSVGKLKNIRAELAGNRTLRECFEPQIGRVTSRQLVANDIALEAFSVGTELRGITFRHYRPTKIVIDDGEDSEAVESPEQREKLALWFNEVLENIGNGYTNVIVIGTLLHTDSLLANILKRPDFESRVFCAIESFAENAALWEDWRARFNDLSDPRRLETARGFFEARCDAMLKGTRVLWPEKEDYYALLCQLTTRGRKAFFKEKQNDPRHHEAQLFDPEMFRCFTLQGGTGILPVNDLGLDNQTAAQKDGSDAMTADNHGQDAHATTDRHVSLDRLVRFGFLDSALGGAGSDFAAVATVGRDEHGYLYLLDVWMERASPTRQIEKIFDLHEIWNYRLFGFEANCFQSLLAQPIEDERRRRREAGRPWDLPIEQVTHRENKLRRVASLETLITNGWLLFSRNLSEEFIQQCEQFPRAAHDDGLDALEAAVSLARRSAADRATAAGAKRSTRQLASF